MKYYVLDEYDRVTIHFLTVLNLSNLFILFFFYFLFLHNHGEQQERTINNTQSNNNRNRNYFQYSLHYNELYEQALSENFPEEEEKCSICLENFDFTRNSNVIKTFYCNHYFHEDCLLQWLRIRPKCPNCNTNLVARFIQDDN